MVKKSVQSAPQSTLNANNKNIILAAEQVKKLLGAAQVDYVPTTNLAQGLAALLHFDAAKTLQENSAVMRREAKEATVLLSVLLCVTALLTG